MIGPRIIKTESRYRAYLAEVDRLAIDDPALGTPDGDRLELLAKLVEDYEKSRFPFARPAPLEAIRFRMEEPGLKQKDLAPLLGGKSRVSEVLAGKRPLTLAAVRASSDKLRIPAELLLREPTAAYGGDDDDDEATLPSVAKAGWFSEGGLARLTGRDIVQRYLEPKHGPLYLKQTLTFGSTPATDRRHLRLRVERARELAQKSKDSRGPWHPDTFDLAFLAYVARSSWSDSGPRLASEFLAGRGIARVVLPALPRTKLDGAAMRGRDGAPIIGLTIRHDRPDDSWFTLIHELVHAWKHIAAADVAITDEDVQDERETDGRESEANDLAREVFIPRSEWKRSEACLRPSFETVLATANRLHIHPAVVAGRLRRERVGHDVGGSGCSVARIVGLPTREAGERSATKNAAASTASAATARSTTGSRPVRRERTRDPVPIRRAFHRRDAACDRRAPRVRDRG